MAQDIYIRFKGDASHLNRTLTSVNRSMRTLDRNGKGARKSLTQIEGAAGRVSSALKLAGAAFVGFAATSGIRGIIQATTTFEGFRAQLTAYLGSQQRANAELARMEQLAKGLPQTLQDLTNGFVVLNRYGISTANESMTAFANIASANNKNMSQLAEALGDALTGEYERLKEFGVKVRSENGRTTVLLGDQILGVANSGQELIGLIQDLGEEGGKYFGAAEKQATTLTGALSRMSDSVTRAQRNIGDAGFGAAVGQLADRMSTALDTNTQLTESISRGLTQATLIAGDALFLLFENFDKVLIAVSALIGIGIVKFMFNLGRMIIGTTVVAVMGLLRAFRGLATFLVRTLIRGALGALALALGKITLVIGAVGAAAYGLAAAWDWVFGTSMKESIDDFAGTARDKIGEIVDEISGLGEEAFESVTGIESLSDALETGKNVMNDMLGVTGSLTDYRAELARRTEELLELSKKNNVQMTQEEAATAALNDMKKKAVQIEEARISKLKEYQTTQETALQNTADALRLEISLLNETESVRAAHLASLKAEQDFIEKNVNLKDGEAAAFRKTILARELEIAKIKEKLNLEKALVEFRRQSTAAEEVNAGASAFNRVNPLEGVNKTYSDELKGLERLRNRDKINEEEYLRAKAKLNVEYSKKINDLRKQDAQQQLELNGVTNQSIIDAVTAQMDAVAMIQQGGVVGAQGALTAMNNVLGQMAGQSKEAFEAHKALSIAQALISTYQAAAMAIAFPPGPPISLIYVAGAIAAGMAQVNAIRSQRYSGRALGGPVMGGESYIVGENGPEMFTPTNSGSITRNDQIGGGRPVEINFTINAVDTASFDELLISRQGVIQSVISDAMLESGQRSRF